MTPVLETARLLLRPLELSDAAQVQLLFPKWEIVRYLTSSVPWPYPPDGVETFYREVALPAVERGDAWFWTIRPRDLPDQIIGSINIGTGGGDSRGFWMAVPWQRQGLMTEACDAVTGFWFDVLKRPLLRVSKAVANVASRRISEKQGMRLVAVRESDYVSGRLPAEVWEITADEWRARRAK